VLRGVLTDKPTGPPICDCAGEARSYTHSQADSPVDLANGFANNGYGRLATALDAVERERAVWPGQLDCDGLAWTRTAS
jgi:hypothetical protein